jgi:hypothetical protein
LPESWTLPGATFAYCCVGWKPQANLSVIGHGVAPVGLVACRGFLCLIILYRDKTE